MEGGFFYTLIYNSNFPLHSLIKSVHSDTSTYTDDMNFMWEV